MKKLLKKLAAIVTMTAVTLTMAVAIPTPASADSIYDTAKAISSGESVSTYIWRYDEADYKITSTENGTLKLSLDAQMPSVTIYVLTQTETMLKYLIPVQLRAVLLSQEMT